MLRIRLTRVGKKNQPAYRVVVAEHWRPIKGRFIEILGHYNPVTKIKGFKGDRIKYWLSVGAKPSVTAHNLLVKEGIISGPKIAITRKKKSDKEEGGGGTEAKTEATKEVKQEVKKEEETKETNEESPKKDEAKAEDKKEDAKQEKIENK